MTKDFYDSEMAAQQERLAATPDMEKQRRSIVRALSPKPGEAILEIGAGNGILARDLVGRVGGTGYIIGIDNSEPILEMAGRICPGAEFQLADAQELPFGDDRFDGVAAAQVLCFLDDPDRALAEVCRVLKPGGRFVVLDTNWDTLVWKSSDVELMTRVMTAYTSLYSDPNLPSSLKMRMIRAGFVDVVLDSFVILNTEFGDDTYARQTANFAIPIMANSRDFTDNDADRWLKDLEDLAQRGDFFFSLNRYVATGVKSS